METLVALADLLEFYLDFAYICMSCLTFHILPVLLGECPLGSFQGCIQSSLPPPIFSHEFEGDLGQIRGTRVTSEESFSVAFRGRKIEHKLFLLKLFGRLRDILAKSRDIPPKKFDFPGFEGHTEPFGPHPFKWKTPTPPENIRTQKFGFVLFFRA